MPRPYAMFGGKPSGMSYWERPDEFRVWLKLNPDKIFKVQDDHCCPIATFLQDVDSPEAIYQYDPHCPKSELKWRHRFAMAVDAEPTPTITAARALEILNKVAPE